MDNVGLGGVRNMVSNQVDGMMGQVDGNTPRVEGGVRIVTGDGGVSPIGRVVGGVVGGVGSVVGGALGTVSRVAGAADAAGGRGLLGAVRNNPGGPIRRIGGIAQGFRFAAEAGTTNGDVFQEAEGATAFSDEFSDQEMAAAFSDEFSAQEAQVFSDNFIDQEVAALSDDQAVSDNAVPFDEIGFLATTDPTAQQLETTTPSSTPVWAIALIVVGSTIAVVLIVLVVRLALILKSY